MPLHDNDSSHRGRGLVLRLVIVLRWRQKGLSQVSSPFHQFTMTLSWNSDISPHTHELGIERGVSVFDKPARLQWALLVLAGITGQADKACCECEYECECEVREVVHVDLSI